MKPFEIYYWQPPHWPKPHPCVVISNPDRVARKDYVELLGCASQQASHAPDPHQFLLDDADGLDWPTLCHCDLIYFADRAKLMNRKGIVSEARQAPLLRRVIAAHGWSNILGR